MEMERALARILTPAGLAPPPGLNPLGPYLGGGSPFGAGVLSSPYGLSIDPFALYSMDPAELDDYLLDLYHTGMIDGASYAGILHSLEWGGRRRGPRRPCGRRGLWDRWYDDGYGGLGLGRLAGFGGRGLGGFGGLGGGFGSPWWACDRLLAYQY